MPQPDDDLEMDFDAQLRGLFQEAEHDMETRAAAARHVEPTRKQRAIVEISVPMPEPVAEPHAGVPLSQMLRPIVLGLEALVRASGDHALVLGKLDRRLKDAAEAEQELPKIMAEMRGTLDAKGGVNQQMFDALYTELRGYKDGFLLESVHRPIIRDIISLYDEQVEIHRQMSATLAEHAAQSDLPFFARLQTLETNLAHNIAFVIEVLARLDVVPVAPGTGKLDKRTQRTVALEFVESPEEDSVVARSVKCGFLWKERLLRPEEVVTKKWKEGLLSGA
ncbi:MAG: grpE 2 [Chthoniobacteraceae bacterium]|nr:grpE 2 [Chthoniobacteraceae bacterium]